MQNQSEKFDPIIQDWKNDYKASPIRKAKKLAVKNDGIKPMISPLQNKVGIRKHSNRNLIRKPS